MKNPEKHRAMRKEHYRKYKHRWLEYGRRWRFLNMEKKVKSTAKWRKENPEKYKAENLSFKIKMPIGKICIRCSECHYILDKKRAERERKK